MRVPREQLNIISGHNYKNLPAPEIIQTFKYGLLFGKGEAEVNDLIT